MRCLPVYPCTERRVKHVGVTLDPSKLRKLYISSHDMSSGNAQRSKIAVAGFSKGNPASPECAIPHRDEFSIAVQAVIIYTAFVMDVHCL